MVPPLVRFACRVLLPVALVIGAPSAVSAFSPDSAPLVAPTPTPGPTLDVPLDGAPFSAAPSEGDSIEDGVPIDELPGDEGGLPPALMPPVFHGDADLPEPVRARRAEIMAAAKSGDPEALRPLIEQSKTIVSSLGGGDPIDILVAQSGDQAGIEILAILLDVLDAGWVRLDAGKPEERYVWPWFAEASPETLDSRQMVEVFRVLTAGDFEDMRAAGTYVFHRVEIGADGRWQVFMSGE